MRFSRACLYALSALVHLSRQKSAEPVTAQHIAAARGIPERFLVKVLKPLVTARILSSLKGPNGGYRLVRSPTDVTLLEVVEAIDGPIRGQVPQFDAPDRGKFDRRLEEACNAAAALVRQRLERVRLSDLVGKGR